MQTEALCRRCGETKPAEAFHRNKTKESGRQSQCAACVNERVKAWYDRTAGKATRNAQLKRNFGISQAEYDALLVAQGGVCAICLSGEPGGRYGATFSVDHDHRTGVVRGLLCQRCNMALGQLEDDIGRLEAAITYLRRWLP